MSLIKAFEENNINGLVTTSPDRVVETIVSKLFFYKNTVYKIYKSEKFFFGDFTDPLYRKSFYLEDFYWNNIMAPHIYLALRGVRIKDGKYELVDIDKAEDFFIEMEKFDDANNLTNLLLAGKIKDNDLGLIVSEMVKRTEKLTKERRVILSNIFDEGLEKLHMAGLESDRNLLYMVPEYISKDKTDRIFDFLKKKSERIDYFKGNKDNLVVSIDNHADNIVLQDNKVAFIDVLPPKESWRVADFGFNICRFATDVAVLLSEDKAEIVYEAFKEIPSDVKAIYEVRSAAIQMWCFFFAKKVDIANKYLSFIEKKVSWLGPL